MNTKSHSEETRRKISETLKARINNNPDILKRYSEMGKKGKGKKHKPLSDTTKNKLRESHKGKFIGRLNPFWGKHHTSETKDINRQKHFKGKIINCFICNKEFKVAPSKLKFHRFCSRKCYFIFNKGEKHHNWKGGVSNAPYSFDFTEELKMLIRKRDNFQCRLCKKPAVIIHHIDYDKNNSNSNNLITLCQSCHSQTNFNRNYWKQFLEKIINEY